MSVNASNADIITINTINVTGKVSHGGLKFSTGDDIDQQRLITVTTPVTAGQYYTITTGNNHLTSTGTYVGQVYISTLGPDFYAETFTFLFTWYADISVATNENSQNNAIFTHNMGLAQNGRIITLRTRRRAGGAPSGGAVLEWTCNFSQPNYTYNWYFRRVL